ncbi:MAG: DedA family protein [Candidatus Rokuibacteriota bacterium]
MEAAQPFLAWLVAHTYVVVFCAMVIDATGIPFPGRILLVAAGSFAAEGAVDVMAVIALGALGAMVGDHVWYLAGRFNARGLLRLYCRLSLRSGRCEAQARDYFARFGALTIAVGRFVAGVRIFAWPLAAANGIGYARFLAWDCASALAWSSTFVLLGYVVGDRWGAVMERFGGLALVLTALAVASLAAVLAVRLWRRARYGAAVPSY